MIPDIRLFLTVIHVHRSPFFTPHTNLRIRFVTEYMHEVHGYEFDARYMHATRKLQIVRGKPTEAPYVIVCEFRYADDDDRLYCSTYSEASLFKIVEYMLVRV